MGVLEILNPSNIEKVYDDLKRASADFYAAEFNHVNAQTNQRAWYAERIAEGAIQGKNDTEREGNARMLRADLYESVEDAYSKMMAARGVLEVCRAEERKVSRIIQVTQLFVEIHKDGGIGLLELYTFPNVARDGADSWVAETEEGQG